MRKLWACGLLASVILASGCTKSTPQTQAFDEQQLREALAVLADSAPHGRVNWFGVRADPDGGHVVSLLPAGGDDIVSIDEKGVQSSSRSLEQHPVTGDVRDFPVDTAWVGLADLESCELGATFAALPLPSGEWLTYRGCTTGESEVDSIPAVYAVDEVSLGAERIEAIHRWRSAAELDRMLDVSQRVFGALDYSSLVVSDGGDRSTASFTTARGSAADQCDRGDAWLLVWRMDEVPEGALPLGVSCTVAGNAESFRADQLPGTALYSAIEAAAEAQGRSVDEILGVSVGRRSGELVAGIGSGTDFTLPEHQYVISG